jgi:hypothetical protein
MGARRVRALALAAVIGIGLAACGGGDDDPEAAEGSTTTTAASEDTSTDGEVDLEDFTGECAEFAEAFTEAGQAIGNAFSGTGDGDLEDVASYFSEVADRMPDEIQADFEVFAAAYTQFAQALAEADIDMSNPEAMDPEAMAALEDVTAAFDSAEVQEASENIQAYMTERCGG